MPSGPEQESRSGYRRGATVLSVGIAASGTLTYAYFALASRELEPASYGNLVVLWSVLFVAVFTLYRPVEQLVSRTIAERTAQGGNAGNALAVAASIQVFIVAAFVAATLLLRGEIEQDLLAGETSFYYVFLIAGPAYAVSFLLRGYLAGSQQFGIYGAMLLLESTSRIAPAVIVTLGLAGGASTVVAGIALAPLMTLSVVPAILLRRERSGGPAPDRPTPSESTGMNIPQGTRFVSAALLIALSEQVLLNAGVIVVNSTGGSPAAGLLFNVMLLARAPQVLFVAVTTSLLPSLSRLWVVGEAGARQFREQAVTTLGALIAAASVVAFVVIIVGPDLMRLTFGDGFDYERSGMLVVVAGMAFHLSALTLTQGALAQRRAGFAAASWITCALLFIVWSLLPVLGDVLRVEVGYAGAVLLLALLLLRFRRVVDSPAAERSSPGDQGEPLRSPRA